MTWPEVVRMDGKTLRVESYGVPVALHMTSDKCARGPSVGTPYVVDAARSPSHRRIDNGGLPEGRKGALMTRVFRGVLEGWRGTQRRRGSQVAVHKK
jgi:hypothetical protein